MHAQWNTLLCTFTWSFASTIESVNHGLTHYFLVQFLLQNTRLKYFFQGVLRFSKAFKEPCFLLNFLNLLFKKCAKPCFAHGCKFLDKKIGFAWKELHNENFPQGGEYFFSSSFSLKMCTDQKFLPIFFKKWGILATLSARGDLTTGVQLPTIFFSSQRLPVRLWTPRVEWE